jgi:serine phosphatase RsbU (regulator of sigma subunit)
MSLPLSGADLAPIVGPFDDAAAGVKVVVEGVDGSVLASAGTTREGGGAATAAREISSRGAVVGRLSVSGDAGAVVDALATSLAAGVEALVEASLLRSAEAHERARRSAAQETGDRLDAELALGRRIQRSFVPLAVPEIPGYEVASHYEAAYEVGGDFFDVFRLRGRTGRLAIVVADVTGKGIAAALLMAFARPLLHAAIDNAREPGEALQRTNRILVDERRSSLFITALCAIVELRSGRLRLANAGHEPPLIVPANGEPIRWLTGSGPLLGAFATLDLDERTEGLEPGDLALLYTDGVTDCRAASGERFGDDRLLEVVEGARAGTAREVVESITNAIAAFQGEMPAADDVTIVAIRRNKTGRGRLRRPD